MLIEPVKSGQALSAVKENQKITAINQIQDQLASLYTPYPVNPIGLVVTAKNETGSALVTGQAFNVSGIRFSSQNKTELTKTYLNSGVSVTASSLSTSSLVTGFALESAKSNKLFKAVILGVAGSLVTFSNTSHTYANPGSNGLVSAPFGLYRIIGSSNETMGSGESSLQKFCIIAPISFGHLIGTTSSTISGHTGSGAQTNVVINQNITIPNVKCPLLRTSESIQSGSKVVLSFNGISREFEIIEAQCEEGSGS